MFLVQSSNAKRTRKYSILMIFGLLMLGGLGPLAAILTLHWNVLPKKK